MTEREAAAAAIRYHRQQAFLSQRRLAENIGISAPHLCKIESGKARPSVALLYELEQSIGICARSVALGFGYDTVEVDVHQHHVTHPVRISIVHAMWARAALAAVKYETPNIEWSDRIQSCIDDIGSAMNNAT